MPARIRCYRWIAYQKAAGAASTYSLKIEDGKYTVTFNAGPWAGIPMSFYDGQHLFQLQKGA